MAATPGDFYSAPFFVAAPRGSTADGASPVPFRHVFSALWHWSSAVVVTQRVAAAEACLGEAATLPATVTAKSKGENGGDETVNNIAPMDDEGIGVDAAAIEATVTGAAHADAAGTANRTISLDLRRYDFSTNPSNEWAPSREEHRLAVQLAMGCRNQNALISPTTLQHFCARFGPIKGSPPECVRRAYASLVVRDNQHTAATSTVKKVNSGRGRARTSSSSASSASSAFSASSSHSSHSTTTDAVGTPTDAVVHLVPWFHGTLPSTPAKRKLNAKVRAGGATHFLVRCSKSEPSCLVLAAASHPAFGSSSGRCQRNWKIRCGPALAPGLSVGGGEFGYTIDGEAYPDLQALIAGRGMVQPFFQPCISDMVAELDPERALALMSERLPRSYEFVREWDATAHNPRRRWLAHSIETHARGPESALNHPALWPTPSIDMAQLKAGISSFDGNIDNAIELFEDVYRRNRLLAREPSVRCLRETLSCARSLGNLGNAQQKMGKSEVAVRYFEECLQLLRRLLLLRVGSERRRRQGDDCRSYVIVPSITLKDLIVKEANIVANLCVVTSHILQVTPGDVRSDERKAGIAVQLVSCLGEELGIAGNLVDAADSDADSAAVLARTYLRHKKLLATTHVDHDWVEGLAGKLLEDGFQMKDDGKALSAAHVFFQAVCIARLKDQAALENLALESLAGMDDIPLVVFLRIWATSGPAAWEDNGGVDRTGAFTTRHGTFQCRMAAELFGSDSRRRKQEEEDAPPAQGEQKKMAMADGHVDHMIGSNIARAISEAEAAVVETAAQEEDEASASVQETDVSEGEEGAAVDAAAGQREVSAVQEEATLLTSEEGEVATEESVGQAEAPAAALGAAHTPPSVQAASTVIVDLR
jgi:tetratricopeptide (TPR) repeat protein